MTRPPPKSLPGWLLTLEALLTCTHRSTGKTSIVERCLDCGACREEPTTRWTLPTYVVQLRPSGDEYDD